MELLTILDKNCCKVNLKAKNKDEVIRKLASLAKKSTTTDDLTEEEIYRYIREREEQGSTGFGNEMAIPHARIKEMKEFLVLCGVSKKGVDFDAMDKKRVRIIFLILGPEEAVNEHLKILAALSRLLGLPRVKNELLQAPSEISLFETILRYGREQNGGSAEDQKMKLLMVNLYIEDFFYNILEFFIEQGIEGATILDSYGMGQYISNIPLFADFIGFMKKDRSKSRTIMALVPETRIDEVLKGIEEITGDMTKKQGAMVMVLSLDFYKGSMGMM